MNTIDCNTRYFAFLDRANAEGTVPVTSRAKDDPRYEHHFDSIAAVIDQATELATSGMWVDNGPRLGWGYPE